MLKFASSFETFFEREVSYCAPQFPMILSAKFPSFDVKESESENLERSELESKRIFTSDSATLVARILRKY